MEDGPASTGETRRAVTYDDTPLGMNAQPDGKVVLVTPPVIR